MLKRVKTEIGELRSFFVAEDTEDTALVVEVVVVEMEWAVHSFPIACSSAVAQIWRSESTAVRIPDSPFSWMQNSPRVTLPIWCASTLYCAAIASTRASEAEEVDTIARAPVSANSANSAASAVFIEISAERPLGLAKQDSARVTARPPSLTSCAEAMARSAARATRQSTRVFSALRSIAGGTPAT